MTRARSIRQSLLYALAAAIMACQDADPVAPVEGLEPFSVAVVNTRTVGPGEARSVVEVTGGEGSVTIRVTSRAMCATQVSAEASRVDGAIDIVARLSSNPAALCGPIPETLVVEYRGTMSGVPAGSYRVRVFEGRGASGARFFGSAVVQVPAG